MPLTLAEAALLSNDVLLQGVIETIVREGGVMSRMPFEGMVGNAITYNRESVLSSGMNWHAVGEEWTEGAKTSVQKTSTLKILGGDVDVDQYLALSRSNVNDQEALEIEAKAKALSYEFERSFIYGSIDADANEPDGLHEMILDDASAQDLHAGATTVPGVLTLVLMDELIDLVRPAPDFLLMSRRSARGLSAYARALTSPVTFTPNEFGKRVMHYDGVPIIRSDHQLNTETISSAVYALPTTGASSTIWAVRLGADGVMAFTNGGVQIEEVGALQTKDARRKRVKMYCGLALLSTLAIACIDGISSGAVTA